MLFGLAAAQEALKVNYGIRFIYGAFKLERKIPAEKFEQLKKGKLFDGILLWQIQTTLNQLYF